VLTDSASEIGFLLTDYSGDSTADAGGAASKTAAEADGDSA
jgi:hypothetical protein